MDAVSDIPQSKPTQGAGQPLAQEVFEDIMRCLREEMREERHSEQAQAQESEPKDDLALANSDLKECEFQLATGNNVKVIFAKFSPRLRYRSWHEGPPLLYYAIKVYSSEDILSHQTAIHCEFRAAKDFAVLALPSIWGWLDDLVKSRRFVEFNSLTEFIDELADAMNQFSDIGEDAVDHVQRLPELVSPETFDKVDDSIFNDQNETELNQ